jgi:hypothetical protein
MPLVERWVEGIAPQIGEKVANRSAGIEYMS